MKLNIEPSVKSLESASLTLARARSQLRHKVGVVLTGSLEALNERIASQWLAPPPDELAAQTHAYRLREVLERDRALVAALPPRDSPDLPEACEAEATSGPAEAPDAEEPETSRPATPHITISAASTPLSAAERKERKRARGREPIRTRTMAKVLVAQGEHERALSIYRELCAQDPDDAPLRAELEALQASMGSASPSTHDAPTEHIEPV